MTQQKDHLAPASVGARTGTEAVALRHYSDKPVRVALSCAQHFEPRSKPSGLWLSVDSCEDNWRSWCEGESYRLQSLSVVHAVELVPNARILRIENDAELLDFHREFRNADADRAWRYDCIDWFRVAAEGWQGIIIAPYQWSMRLDERVRWYYGWDCASGCVWDSSAIASITAMAPEQERSAA